MQAFKLTERDLRPGCVEVGVEGELDLAVADQLQRVLARVGAENDQVLIDLSSCDFIDSTGIATILQARQRMSEEGRRLVIHGATKQVDRILEVTGLTTNGLVFASAEEALAAAPDK